MNRKRQEAMMTIEKKRSRKGGWMIETAVYSIGGEN